MKNYKLTNGVEIPVIGFGTWQTPNDEIGINAVKSALEAGYNHIDTAQAYGNEASVGKAIIESGVSRKEIFITSKLDNPMPDMIIQLVLLKKHLKILEQIILTCFLFTGLILCSIVIHGRKPMLKHGRRLKSCMKLEKSEQSV